MEENVTLAMFYFLLGAILLLYGYVLYKNIVKRNMFFGFRFEKSLSSDEMWYRINRYGGKCMILWSIPYFILGGLYIIFPALLEYLFLIILGLLTMIGPMIQTYIYSRKV